jgi:hypothetical protein
MLSVDFKCLKNYLLIQDHIKTASGTKFLDEFLGVNIMILICQNLSSVLMPIGISSTTSLRSEASIKKHLYCFFWGAASSASVGLKIWPQTNLLQGIGDFIPIYLLCLDFDLWCINIESILSRCLIQNSSHSFI